MIKHLTSIFFICIFSCNLQEKKTIILSKASSKYIDWISEENIIILDAYNIKNTDYRELDGVKDEDDLYNTIEIHFYKQDPNHNFGLPPTKKTLLKIIDELSDTPYENNLFKILDSPKILTPFFSTTLSTSVISVLPPCIAAKS